MKSFEISQLLIFVPQGAEYQSVMQGLKNCPNPPQILPIPVGIVPVTRYLENWWQKQDKSPLGFNAVLLMGLGGSLSTELGLGQATLIKSCLKREKGALTTIHNSDPQLNLWIQQRLGHNVSLVQGITSDRVITQATEKQKLGQTLNCQVVDMEGWAVLEFFAEKQIPVSILRVISDEVNQSLPDLSRAYDTSGNLKAIALTVALLQKPIAGLNLIRGSLQALKRLEQVVCNLFTQ
ncbi:MAG: hypothetical protein VKJ02_02480 [Snowella sp.]|nr:hypothetical protein [Snowella sp.]